MYSTNRAEFCKKLPSASVSGAALVAAAAKADEGEAACTSRGEGL